jgi:hypothetical protein
VCRLPVCRPGYSHVHEGQGVEEGRCPCPCHRKYSRCCDSCCGAGPRGRLGGNAGCVRSACRMCCTCLVTPLFATLSVLAPRSASCRVHRHRARLAPRAGRRTPQTWRRPQPSRVPREEARPLPQRLWEQQRELRRFGAGGARGGEPARHDDDAQDQGAERSGGEGLCFQHLARSRQVLVVVLPHASAAGCCCLPRRRRLTSSSVSSS